MPHPNLSNINQITLTNFRRAYSELGTPTLPWSNLSGEPLQTVILSCFKYWKGRSAPQRCDFKCNLFQFLTLNTQLEQDPLGAVCNSQTMLLTQLTTLSQHRDLQHFQTKQSMTGSTSQAWSRVLIKHYRETRHITWLCLIPLVRLTAARASHSSLPKNSAPHVCRVNFLHCPRSHARTTSDPALLTDTGSIRGPSPGGTLFYKHWQADERKKAEWWKSAQTCRRKDVWLKNCRKTSSHPSSKKQEL